ncbi:MAG TPA: hypothetical protein VHL58_07495, partial [Thermoanaerobaculia bacterium]|nr:hypothetical protein [Thermoanaerobaculia bacterium]
MTILALLQALPPPSLAGGESLAWNEVLGEYIKFAGYFLAIGATAYRYLILPRFDPSHSEDAVIGRTSAATIGLAGVALILLSSLGG